MINILKTPLRVLLVALALCGAAAPAAVATDRATTREVVRDDAYATKAVSSGDADLGVLWIVVGLVVVVFFVWVCAKIGDNRPSDGVMG